MAIEGSMMKFAQCQSVGNDRVAARFGVRHYMGGIQQFLVTQSAQRALLTVGSKYSLSKRSLVQSLPEAPSRVRSPDLGFRLWLPVLRPSQQFLTDYVSVIHCHAESQLQWIVCHDKHRPGCQIPPFDDAVEIRQRHAELHHAP
jgi:hypothetical protein